MTPTTQPNEYDCLRACVCTILDLALEDVPSFTHQYGKDYKQKFVEFLEARGYTLICIPYKAVNSFYCCFPHIAIGKRFISSPVHHAVVCIKDEIVHDPHYEPCELEEKPFERWFIVKPPQ